MARISDTTVYPITAPAPADRLFGTDVSNIASHEDGESVQFEISAIIELVQSSVTITASSNTTFTNKTIDAGANTLTGITASSLAAAAGIALSQLATGVPETVVGLPLGASPGPLQSLSRGQLTALVNAATTSAAGAILLDGDANKVLHGDGSWAEADGGLITSASDPSSAPASVGLTYINTATQKRWTSYGTGSVSDWVEDMTANSAVLPSALTDTPITGADRFTFGDDSDGGNVKSRSATDTISDLSIVTLSGTQTLTDKTLTAPVSTIAVNAQTGTSYTFVLADASKLVTVSNGSTNTTTIPTNASVAFPVGTIITVQQIGAGTTTIVAASGVTLQGVSAGSGEISAQWGSVSLIKIATNTWLAIGAIETVS